MRTVAVLVTGTALALVAGCNGPRDRKAMAYVEKCTPGQSYEACEDALRRSDGHAEAIDSAIPRGGLVAIRINLMPAVFDPPPGRPLHVVIRHSFDYSMQAATDAAYAAMVKTLEAELGPPAHGRPPALGTHASTEFVLPDEIYWTTEEGNWTSSPGTVSWFSLPLEGYEAGSGQEHLDPFVRPAPKSAALWRKVGRVLIDQ